MGGGATCLVIGYKKYPILYLASLIVNTLEKSVLNPDNIVKRKAVRNYTNVNIDRISYLVTNNSYSNFFETFLLRNQPCILSSVNTEAWKSRKDWVNSDGKPNFEFLRKTFGSAVGPVANCKKEKYSAQPKEDKTFADFVDYWQSYIESDYPESMDNLYLKDWHFTRDFPDYTAYETPCGFMSDWLNEFWDTKDDDDYRFVYMGPKGSWTPFHADVFRSFSWSANICGRKKWIFYPPGEEGNLRNKYGHLVYDVDSAELLDENLYPNYKKVSSRIEVIQEAGEIIYVPSGWHHQVYNLEDTISINHNWMNGCNVDICWEYVKDNLSQVQQEIEDCKGMDGWDQQCQLILKASCGIDYGEFLQFMEVIATNRIRLLQDHLVNKSRNLPTEQRQSGSDETQSVDNIKCLADEKQADVSGACDSYTSVLNERLYSPMTEGQINHCVFDLYSVKNVLCDMIRTPEFTSLNDCENKANELIVKIEKIINSII